MSNTALGALSGIPVIRGCHLPGQVWALVWGGPERAYHTVCMSPYAPGLAVLDYPLPYTVPLQRSFHDMRVLGLRWWA